MSWSHIGPEVWLACAYCLAVVGLAYAIDRLARKAASSAEGGVTGGFVYHEDHDAWQCPEDQWLWPQSFDPENRVMRYRASPSICNSCPVKDSCTSSATGREVQRAVDSWPASEAARFHRGIACAVVVLGLIWPVATALSGPNRSEQAALGVAVVLALTLSIPLWSHLRSNSVFLPEGMATKTLDDTVHELAIQAAEERRRRSRYGSDRQSDGDS